MAPIVLKIKASQNNDNFSPFAEMDTGDDLARAWKVCTKVKDALEHGNRLENLSWRLWHLHQSLVTSKKMTQPEFRKQATRTTRKLNENDITSCHHQHLLQNSPRQSAINHPSPPASTSTPPSSPPASTSLHTDDFPTPRRHLAASLDQSAARRPSMSGLTLFPSNPILLPYHVSSQQPQTVASKRPSPCIFTRNGSTSAPTPPYVSPPLESAMLSGPPSFTSETSEGDDSDTDMMDIKLDTDEPSPTPIDTSSTTMAPALATLDAFSSADFDAFRRLFSDDHEDASIMMMTDTQPLSVFDPSEDDNFLGALLSHPLPNLHLPQREQHQPPVSPTTESCLFWEAVHAFSPSSAPSTVVAPEPIVFSLQDTSLHEEPFTERHHPSVFSTATTTTTTMPLVLPTNMASFLSPDAVEKSSWLDDAPSRTVKARPSRAVKTVIKPQLAQPKSPVEESWASANAIDREALAASMAATLCFLQQNAAKDVETSKETSKTAPSFPQLTTTKNTSTLKPAPPSILVKSVPTTSIQPTSRSIIPPPPPKARPTSTVPVSSAKPTLPASPKSLLSQQPSPTLPTQSPPPTSPRLKPKPALSETPTPTVTSHSATVCSDLACANCGVTSTPLWRRGLNDDVLCNACGLYLKLHHVNRPKTLRPTSKKDTEGLPSVECHNCMTKNTPLWRRDDEGRPLCNACGLYHKLHNEPRPLSMKTDVIRKRHRNDDVSTPPTPTPATASAATEPPRKRHRKEKTVAKTVARPETVGPPVARVGGGRPEVALFAGWVAGRMGFEDEEGEGEEEGDGVCGERSAVGLFSLEDGVKLS